MTEDREAYIKDLEHDNVALAGRLRATQDQAIEFSTENAELNLQVDRLRNQLADAVQTEAALREQISALRRAADAESNAIAYRFPRRHQPDIVVRWAGGDQWAVTDGVNRYWTRAGHWIAVQGSHQSTLRADLVRFSRTDALTHAQALVDAAHKETRNPT